MPRMYDAIYPQNLPPGGDAYLGYADGRWPDYLAIAAQHGNVPVYALTVFGTPGVGVGVDYEPGDASLETAAQYLADAVRAGVVDRPIGYCSALDAKGLVDAVTALGVDRTAWRLLTAHYGPQGAHLCGPSSCGLSPYDADGTQWNSAGPYDESLISDHFLGAATYPGDEVTDADLQKIVTTLTPVIHDQVNLAVRQLLTPDAEGYARILADVEAAIDAKAGAITRDVTAALLNLPKAEPVSLKGSTATVTFN